MEYIFRSYSSWWWLMAITAVLLGLYFALGVIDNLTSVLKIRRAWRTNLRSVLRVVRILFEPVAIAIWLGTLVLINPAIHGILLLAGVALIHTHIRNYLSGRILLLENSLRETGELVVEGEKGEIVRMGRLGIKLRMQEGLQHIGYQDLIDRGYVLASGSETGEFYTLKIEKESESGKKARLVDLKDLLATSPYVDWSVEPVLVPYPNATGQWQARVQLRKDAHLPELLDLLGEAGYQCSAPNPPTNGNSEPWSL